jgi:protein SCO1/2
MKNSSLWILILMVAAIGIVFGFVIERPHTFRGSVIDPAVPAPEFTLLSSQGDEYRLGSRSGKFILIFFGYTHCPDVCPTTLYEMKQIKAELQEKSDHVEYVFVTVDPDRDTQEQLARYLTSFDQSFFGLTGSTQQLEQVWKDYGVYREIQETSNSLGYLVDHTSRLYLINPQGELMMTYLYETNLDEIVSDLKYLIKKADL